METTALENAAIMLEVTKGVYERHGLKEEAKQPRGLEECSRAIVGGNEWEGERVRAKEGER